MITWRMPIYSMRVLHDAVASGVNTYALIFHLYCNRQRSKPLLVKRICSFCLNFAGICKNETCAQTQNVVNQIG
jgi:hypothetical protein